MDVDERLESQVGRGRLHPQGLPAGEWAPPQPAPNLPRNPGLLESLRRGLGRAAYSTVQMLWDSRNLAASKGWTKNEL